MRSVLAFTLATVAATALAAETPEQSPQARVKAGGGPDQIVCRRVEQIGSRLDSRRICRTRAEWAALQEQERQVLDRVQAFRPCPPVC